jgi:hypothetical protein
VVLFSARRLATNSLPWLTADRTWPLGSLEGEIVLRRGVFGGLCILLSLLLVDHHQVSQTHLLRFNQISYNITCLELHIVSFETMSTVPSKSHDMRKDVEIDMVERCEASSSDDLPEINFPRTVPER